MKSLLINKDFSQMWYSNFAIILGDRFREIIIPLIVLGLSGSPLITALVVMSQQVGSILFAIPVGAWVEKKNKPLISAVANFSYAILLLLLAFLIMFESSLLIAIVLFLMGLFALISRTAFNVMIPAVAGRKNLMPAHTSLETADAVTTLIGPVVGGILYTYTGSFYVLLICAALSMISSICLFKLRNTFFLESVSLVDKSTHQDKSKSFIKEAMIGFNYLSSSLPQFIHVITISVLSFTTVFIMLIVVIHGEITMELSPSQIGLLLSAAGVGNVIGVLVLNYCQNTNWILLLSILLSISGGGVIILFLSDSFWLSFISVMIFDGALSMAFVIQAAAHQGITPDQVLTRVRSATYVIGGLFGLAGTFFAGFLSEVFGTVSALMIGSAVLIIPAVFIVLYIKRGAPINRLHPIHIDGG